MNDNHPELDMFGDNIPHGFDYERAYLNLRRAIIEGDFAQQSESYLGQEIFSMESTGSSYIVIKDARDERRY